MIIDAHLHVGFRNCELIDIIKQMDDIGIDQSWLLSWDELMPSINNMYTALTLKKIIEATDKYPKRFIAFYCPDPRRKNSLMLLEQSFISGVQGVGELKVSLQWMNHEITRFLERVNREKMCLTFHMEEAKQIFEMPYENKLNRFIVRCLRRNYRQWLLFKKTLSLLSLVSLAIKYKLDSFKIYHPGYLPDFDGLEKNLKRFPDIKFIGHGPLFWKGIDGEMKLDGNNFPSGCILKEGISCRLLQQYPNMYADLSGKSGFNAITRDEKFGHDFILKFQEKLLFGTDNFNLGQLQYLKNLNIEDSVLNKLLFVNAHKMIKSDER